MINVAEDTNFLSNCRSLDREREIENLRCVSVSRLITKGETSCLFRRYKFHVSGR